MEETTKYKAYSIKHNRIIEKVTLTTSEETFDWTIKGASSDEITLNPLKCREEFILIKNSNRVDKNETPIYEGDKLNKDGEIFVVLGTDKGFIVSDVNKKTKSLYPFCTELVVVGNILEKNI